MGLAILYSRAQIGIEAPQVTIEVFLSGGIPTFGVVGLAETAVRESKDRVRGAIISSRYRFPQERITVNLGPADMKKTGGRFDLSIALGILAAGGQISDNVFRDYEFYGELALNGDIRRVPGVLPAAIKAAAAGRTIVVPKENGEEAFLASGQVIVAESLLEVTAILSGRKTPQPLEHSTSSRVSSGGPDLEDVKGQVGAKRALEVAAAGGHNILFIGPPGTGKSMLAQRMPGLLPPMDEQQAMETAAVTSVLGVQIDVSRWRCRPFRAPHHTASAAALAGGGSDPRPGEISRSHNGVLFLDELPEFTRHVLEVLRQPLENGRILISRAGQQAEFPASFQLVAAMNPCPCGYLGDRTGDCGCSGEAVKRYRGRISGPLLDRIDIQVQVNRTRVAAMRPDAPRGEKSSAVAARVTRAQEIQIQRSGRINARLTSAQLNKHYSADEDSFSLLDKAADRLPLSARAYQRVQRVAQTIADLAGKEIVTAKHVAEALGLRQLDRKKI